MRAENAYLMGMASAEGYRHISSLIVFYDKLLIKDASIKSNWEAVAALHKTTVKSCIDHIIFDPFEREEQKAIMIGTINQTMEG